MIAGSPRRRRSARPTWGRSARSPSSAPSWRSSRHRRAHPHLELSDKRVKNVTDVLSEGEEVLVKVISVDRAGKIRLSRKEALADAAGKKGRAGRDEGAGEVAPPVGARPWP